MNEIFGRWKLAVRMPNHMIFTKVCLTEGTPSPCMIATLAGAPLSLLYPDLIAAKSACESMERKAKRAKKATSLNVGGARNARLFQIGGMVFLETLAGAWLSFSTEAGARAHLAAEEESEARASDKSMPKHGLDFPAGRARRNPPKEAEPKDGRRKPLGEP